MVVIFQETETCRRFVYSLFSTFINSSYFFICLNKTMQIVLENQLVIFNLVNLRFVL